MNTSQERIDKLANKKIWLTVLLSVIFPAAGYIYTARWKAFGMLFAVGAGVGAVMGAVSTTEEEAMAKTFAVVPWVGTVVAPVDNAFGVSRARKKKSAA